MNARANEIRNEIIVLLDELVELAVPDSVPEPEPIPPSVFIVGDKIVVKGAVNTRPGPSTSFKSFGIKKVGETGVVLEANGIEADGYVWALIKWDSDGLEGYTAEGYLEKVTP